MVGAQLGGLRHQCADSKHGHWNTWDSSKLVGLCLDFSAGGTDETWVTQVYKKVKQMKEQRPTVAYSLDLLVNLVSAH